MLPSPVTLCLPIADRPRSHAFYTDGLGLGTVGELADDGVPEPLRVVVNEGLHLMLIPTGGFGWTVAGRTVALPGTVECQLSISVPDGSAVVELVERARAAGAEVALEPGDQGWAYAGSFADPDGHLWLVVQGD